MKEKEITSSVLNTLTVGTPLFDSKIKQITVDKPIDGRANGKRADILFELEDGKHIIAEIKAECIKNNDVFLMHAFAQAMMYRTKLCRWKGISKSKVFIMLILPGVSIDFMNTMNELQTAITTPILIMATSPSKILSEYAIPLENAIGN